MVTECLRTAPACLLLPVKVLRHEASTRKGKAIPLLSKSHASNCMSVLSHLPMSVTVTGAAQLGLLLGPISYKFSILCISRQHTSCLSVPASSPAMCQPLQHNGVALGPCQRHNKLVWKRVEAGRREAGRPYVALGRGSVWLAVRKDRRPTASSKSSVLRPLLQEARGCVGVSFRAGLGRRGSRDCARADGAPCAWGRRAVRDAWWLPDHVIFRCGGLCDCRLHCFRT